MSTNPLVQLHSLGQSVWLDQMRRSLLTTGELKRLIEKMASAALRRTQPSSKRPSAAARTTPSSWNNWRTPAAASRTFTKTSSCRTSATPPTCFAAFTTPTTAADGFVSLEVSPLLANDTKATIEEAKRLFARLNRPNVMIKVPATPAGLPAIEELIALRPEHQRHLDLRGRGVRAGCRSLHQRPGAPRRRRLADGPHRLGRQLLRQPH